VEQVAAGGVPWIRPPTQVASAIQVEETQSMCEKETINCPSDLYMYICNYIYIIINNNIIIIVLLFLLFLLLLYHYLLLLLFLFLLLLLYTYIYSIYIWHVFVASIREWYIVASIGLSPFAWGLNLSYVLYHGKDLFQENKTNLNWPGIGGHSLHPPTDPSCRP
jgi:hypothetical protein